jgi:pyrroline-5-carboxylate reductase
MKDTRIAIIGLGRLGQFLLERLLGIGDAGPHIVCAVETGEDIGRRRADALGIALVGIDELVRLGEDIDVIFVLTDDAVMPSQLRQILAANGNQHTQVLSEKDLRLIGMLVDGRQDCPA